VWRLWSVALSRRFCFSVSRKVDKKRKTEKTQKMKK
jgi:hypothetical protein